MRQAYKADTLEGVIENFELSGLEADSPFYVDIDVARNGEGVASVRQRIVRELQRCSKYNQQQPDQYQYRKLLFVGHKASGKTTELHRIHKELEGQYETIFVGNIEQQQDRIAAQPDFLYFIVESLVRYCHAHENFSCATEEQVKRLQQYLQDRIFGQLSQTFENGTASQMGVELGAEADTGKVPFLSVLKLFGSLSAKETLVEEQKQILNKTIRFYINDFVEIANDLLYAMQKEARKSGRMLLLILDGLDKVREQVAEEIFLSTQSFLPKLKISMIVTFPLYLNYSPDYDRAAGPFDGRPYILSVVAVHKRDGSRDSQGIQALQDIVEKRMDVDALLEQPKDLQEAILNSGGNLRDLFTFLREAAVNADIMGREQISSVDLQVAYQQKRNTLERQLVKSYMKTLNEVYHDTEKESIIPDNQSDNTLLLMFNAGLLIEYNGKRWVDLHPLVKQLVSERIQKGSWKVQEGSGV